MYTGPGIAAIGKRMRVPEQGAAAIQKSGLRNLDCPGLTKAASPGGVGVATHPHQAREVLDASVDRAA